MATLSLLGLAGTAASTVAGWLSPVLIGLSALLLGRAHYSISILRRGNRSTVIVTWLATMFVVGFWAWQWVKWTVES